MSGSEQTKGYGRLNYGEGRYGDDPEFALTITGTNSPVVAGDTVEVEIEIENLGGEGAQEIELVAVNEVG